MNSANGNQFFEWIRQGAQGGGSAAHGQDRRVQLKEQMVKPEMQPDHPLFVKAKYDALAQ